MKFKDSVHEILLSQIIVNKGVPENTEKKKRNWEYWLNQVRVILKIDFNN